MKTGIELSNATLSTRNMSTRQKSSAPEAPSAGPPAPVPVNARLVALSVNLTLEAAFQGILQNCLEQVGANLTGVLARDAECLHQMRVGLRRLRAALGLFKQTAPLPVTLRTDLDWLSALLGKARDWDVLIAETLPRVGGGDWHAGRQTLRDRAEVHAATAHKALLRALRSQRYQRLLPALSDWIGGSQWRLPLNGVAPSQLDRPVRKGLQPLLDKTWRRLRQRLRQADPDDAATLHQVRIAAKKARYAAEFFQSLLPPKPAARYLRRLAALQDGLGSLNDLVVARTLLTRLESDTAAARQIGFADGYLAALSAAAATSLRPPIAQARRRKGLKAC